MLQLFTPFGGGGFQLTGSDCVGARRVDGWYSPSDECWDLWVSNDLVATISRTAVRWGGTYYGDDLPRKDFSDVRYSPRNVMAQIEDYVTAALAEAHS